MSELLLVRHGQAAAFSADSDRLTDLGARQARALGDYWAARGEAFDRVVCGGLRRHRQTYEQVAEAYADAGLQFPEAVQDPGWNEYDAGAIMSELGEVLRNESPHYAKLSEDASAHAGGPERNRYFQRAFEVLMDAWVSGHPTPASADAGFEPFATFHARVMAARERILTSRDARRVAVFSSGGPIGVAVAAGLDAPPEQALRVNWRVRNASLTRFLFSANRLSFDAFNLTPHLDATPELITFR